MELLSDTLKFFPPPTFSLLTESTQLSPTIKNIKNKREIKKKVNFKLKAFYVFFSHAPFFILFVMIIYERTYGMEDYVYDCLCVCVYDRSFFFLVFRFIQGNKNKISGMKNLNKDF